MENNLPQGWAKCSLIDLCSKPQYGWTSKAGGSGVVKYLRTTDISRGDVAWDLVPYCVEEPKEVQKYQVKKDDILVSRAGSVGFNHRIKDDVPFAAVFASYLIRFQPYDETLAHYIEYFLRSEEYWSQISDFTAGIAIPNVNASKLEQLDIPLPPECEIKRIIDKLDSLFDKIETNKKRLQKIPQILKRFRQSVLADAVSGRLVVPQSEWREVELRTLVGKNGIFDGPFGSNLKTADYVDDGVRVIRLENIEHLSFIKEKQTYITEKKYQSLLRHEVREGDMIFSSFISDEIRACILPKLETRAIAKADCFCIRPNEKLVDKRFLLFSLVSGNAYNQLVLNIHGATRPRINTTQLKSLLLSIPSIDEQKEIVKRIQELFSFANKIEDRYMKAKTHFDKLPQSILAKAFRGELVPQDSDEEPANLLLDRILTAKRIKK
jgi:type I restriction enzyme S subunit